MFFFVEIQCEITTKAGMIIQRVVLNSRPGMYFSAVKEQCACYGCLVPQVGEGETDSNLRDWHLCSLMLHVAISKVYGEVYSFSQHIQISELLGDKKV